MYDVIIWGTGHVYNRYANLIKFYEREGQFHVVGITSNDSYYNRLDGYPFIKKNDLVNTEYDWIIVCATKAVVSKIRQEAGAVGIDEDTLISAHVLEIPNFSFDKYIQLSESKVSIFSNTCWGGIISQQLGLKVRSPFRNMFESDSEYVHFLANAKELLLHEKLCFQRMVYNETLKFEYPIFTLGEMQINMNHYPDREEAEKKWYERVDRINWDNIFVMMISNNLRCVEEFSRLPFPKKVCFTSLTTDIPSACHIPTDKIDPTNDLRLIVTGGATGKYPLFDPIELLLTGCVINNRVK